MRTGLPVKSAFDLFSERKWTPEGIRYHRRAMVMSLVMAVTLIGGHLVMHWIRVGWGEVR